MRQIQIHPEAIIKRSCALIVIAAVALLGSCRRERVWSGLEFERSGKALRLSSDEPFCGCLDAINVSSQPIYLRSSVRLTENKLELVERGHLILGAGKEIKERFDWAGLTAEDVYQLDAWTAEGKPLKIRDVLRVRGDGWPFAPCDTHECKLGPLFMNTGALHQR